MNDLNDSSEWNIRPVPNEGPDGGKWNYALLIPMLGLAAYHWIWKHESQKQIQVTKGQFEQNLRAIGSDLELKHKEKQHLAAELKKERQRVKNYMKALDSESEKRADGFFEDVAEKLGERQNAYCSPLIFKQHRLKIEKKLLDKVAQDPLGVELGLEDDLTDIFKYDKHCAERLNMDERKNGKLMWLYLKYWRGQVTLQKHERAAEALIGSNVK